MRVSVSPAAAVLYPLLLCTEQGRMLLPPLLPAVVFHELGHLLALRLCGIPVRELRFGAPGLLIDTAAIPCRREELICALSGPVAGLVWADAARRIPGAWALRSAQLSLSLSAFNLLPVPLLDGGRALAALLGSGRAVRILGGAVTALLVLFSARDRAWSLAAASLLLFLSCLRP